MAIPEFCPNPRCCHHHTPNVRAGKRWFRHQGSYPTKLHGNVPRFRCLSCGRSFSTQTFSQTYYDKIKVDYFSIAFHLCSGQGIRQTARNLGFSHKVVARRQAKLVPQVLSLHARVLKFAQLDSHLVLGGMESFAYSKNFPTSIQLMVGSQSEVVWGFNTLTQQRKGHLTTKPKKKGAHTENDGVTFPQKLIDRVSELCRTIQKKVEKHPQAVALISDEHPCYPMALEVVMIHDSWQHRRISTPNPMTRNNPLYPVNNLVHQIRKDLAEHAQITTKFAKRPERQVGRLAIYLAWHHAQKPVQTNQDKNHRYHLEKVGFSPQEIEREWTELFSVRRFGTREPLTQWHRRVWNREDRNPSLHQAAMPKYLRVERIKSSRSGTPP